MTDVNLQQRGMIYGKWFVNSIHDRCQPPAGCFVESCTSVYTIFHFTAQYGRGGHVGTHGPCVRAGRMKHKCTIIRADARAVRPYMRSNSLPINCFTPQSAHDWYVGTHGSCVRPAWLTSKQVDWWTSCMLRDM